MIIDLAGSPEVLPSMCRLLHLGICLAMGLLCLLTLGPPCAGAELPIVDLLPPGADRGDVRGDLNRWLSERTGSRGDRVSLEAPPAALLDSARWLPTQDTLARCHATVKALAGDLPLGDRAPGDPLTADVAFTGLMERADLSLLELSLDQVLIDASAAWALLPCRHTVLSRAELRRLFLYEAVTHFYLDDGQDAALFRELLAADPRLYLEPDYPPRVQDAFLEVARQASRVSPARLPTGSLSGEVYVDGAPMVGDAMVQPGRHVLQILSPYGDVRTVILPVDAASAGADPLELPSGMVDALTLPDDAAAKRRLARGLDPNATLPEAEEGGLTGGAVPSEVDLSRRALLRWMQVQGKERIALALGPGGDVVVYDATGQRHPPSLGVLTPLLREDPQVFYPGGQGPTGPSVGAGLLYSAFAAPGEPTVLHPSHLGLGFRGTLPLGPVLGVAKASLSLSSPARGGSGRVGQCGAYLGGEPGEGDQSGAADCLPLRPSGGIGAGVGMPFALPFDLVLTPTLLLEAAFIPEVLSSTGSEGAYVVYRALGLGPQLSANLRYDLNLMDQPLKAWAEPYVGALLTRLGDRATVALPMGLMAGVEVAF